MHFLTFSPLGTRFWRNHSRTNGSKTPKQRNLKTFGNLGRYSGNVLAAKDLSKLPKFIPENFYLTVRGNGQSYGPVSINQYPGVTITQRSNDSKLALDEVNSILTVSANISVKKANEFLEKHGFTLPVMPGAPLATIGGCIASDVHGKNGFSAGSFGDHLESLVISTQSEIKAIKLLENEDLFKKTIGGFGLTGMIIEAKIRVKKKTGRSLCLQTIKSITIEELISNLVDVSQAHEYTGAWFNINGKPSEFKGIVFYSDWKDDQPKVRLHIPNWVMRITFLILGKKYFRKGAIRFINFIQWRRRHDATRLFSREIYFPAFYLPNWNKIFGNTFIERQFLVSLRDGPKVLKELSDLFRHFKVETPFGGLKIFKGERIGYMSFPNEGLSITVQFSSIEEELNLEITKLIEENNSSEYIAKMQISSSSFPSGYPNYPIFRELFDISRFRSTMLTWLIQEADKKVF